MYLSNKHGLKNGHLIVMTLFGLLTTIIILSIFQVNQLLPINALSSNNGQKSNSMSPSAVSVNIDRKIYSPGASVRIFGYVYNSSGHPSSDAIVTIKINKIKIDVTKLVYSR